MFKNFYKLDLLRKFITLLGYPTPLVSQKIMENEKHIWTTQI